MPKFSRSAGTFAVIIFTIPVVRAQIISGSATVTLSGPATREVIAQAETKALQQLKEELLQWLADETEMSIDTTNRVANLAFHLFLDSCRQAAKTESSFQGKQLTLSYLLTGDNIRRKMESFNAAVDARARQAWRNLQEALPRRDIRAIHTEGITAIFYALAHLGPPIPIPEGGSDLADDARRIVQMLYDKMKVQSSGLILAGKTGLDIQNPPAISISVDSIPFSGSTFTGRLQDGTVLFSSVTDDNGGIVFDTFKIPFVPNGTLLDIGPDAAPILHAKGFLDPVQFGVKLDKGQVQSFIFKIISPVYTLDYKAVSVSNITMPPDFADDAHVKAFLRDSCFLKEKNADGPADLAIAIKAQLSSYTYDATEETGIKVTAEIIVNGLLFQPPKTNKKVLVFEKRYGRYLTPPYGLYFWEANGKLRQAIKATIAGL